MPTTIPKVTTRATVHRAMFPGKAQHGTGVMRDRVHHNSKRAIRRMGSKGKAYVKLRAPVDTGYMKSKVDDEIGPDGFSVKVFVDGWKSEEIGAFYAVYVEYGTRRMRAQPFFWPGIRLAQREFLAEMKQVFR